MTDTSLIIDSVYKDYYVSSNPATTLKESVIRMIKGKYYGRKTINALKNVCLTIDSGKTIGIIGHNGAGKSTLLRLICGLGRPTRGKIKVNGTIGSLLELGAGFHPDLTGRENIVTGCVLNGLKLSEIKQIEDDIIGFAELDEFIDYPVRTYSSGMFLRLAFSTAINLNPDVLVIDEILSVGDLNFQKKCIDRISKFIFDKKTLIITSHDTNHIKLLCEEVCVLEEGRLVAKCNPDEALNIYYEIMKKRTERRAGIFSNNSESDSFKISDDQRIGTFEAAIETVKLFNDSGAITEHIFPGDSLAIDIGYQVNKQSVTDMVMTLSIYNEENINCYETHVSSLKDMFGKLGTKGNIRCKFENVPLFAGTYYINIGLYAPESEYVYDFIHNIKKFNVIKDGSHKYYSKGLVSIKTEWTDVS